MSKFEEAKSIFESKVQLVVCALAVQNTTNEFVRVSKDDRKINVNFTVGTDVSDDEILNGADPMVHGELHFKKNKLNNKYKYGAFLRKLVKGDFQPGDRFVFSGILVCKPGRPGTVFNNFEVVDVAGYPGEAEDKIDLSNFMSHEEWLEVTAVLRNGKPVVETSDAAAPEAPEM